MPASPSLFRRVHILFILFSLKACGFDDIRKASKANLEEVRDYATGEVVSNLANADPGPHLICARPPYGALTRLGGGVVRIGTGTQSELAFHAAPGPNRRTNSRGQDVTSLFL